MTIVVVVLIVVAAVAVFAIAAAVIGREAHRLDALAPRAVYVFDDAVAFVADHIPTASQGRLSYGEVGELLRIHMNRLWEQGLAPDGVTDRPQDIEQPVVVDETDVVGYVLGQVDRLGLDVEDADVAAVIDAHQAYFAHIGAVGPPAEADQPDEPSEK
jgi:hypothetical protein